jgi:septum formation protein
MILYDVISKYRLILASRSPRRQQLLTELGLKYEIILPPDDKETYPGHLKKEGIPVFLAKKKAEYFKDRLKDNEIVITADTIVWLKNKELGKPSGRDEAIKMVQSLSGNCHIVYTGVCLTTNKKQQTFFSETKVFFRKLTLEEITFYIDACKPYDKAGAYGVQEWIGYTAIERIEGSYFNVMGLPIDRLWAELEKFID